MKKVLFFVLLFSFMFTLILFSSVPPMYDDNIEHSGNNNGNNIGSNNNGNNIGSNNNGNNIGSNNNAKSNIVKPPKLYISSSHTIKKDNGFVSGDIQVSVKNDSELKITSIKLVLKSDNQSTISIGSWSEIKPSYEKTSTRINLVKSKYPVAVCTYTYNGNTYSKEYSY